jgi:hypothetical protein
VAQRDVRVLVQEVPQRRDNSPSMGNIVLPNGRAEIVHQHVPDLLASTIALEQTTTKHNRKRFGNVLVFGNGLNLIRREVTEADEVFKRDHPCLHRRGHQRGILQFPYPITQACLFRTYGTAV